MKKSKSNYILSISGELITFIAKHPRLTRYNVYVTMFFHVLKTFAYFLTWYGFYIFAFSMGFYIMLHKVGHFYDN